MDVTQKIRKAKGGEPDDFEIQVAQEIYNLQMSSDLKADLHGLCISAAKEIEVGGGRKAIIIFVPFKQLRDYNKLQTRLIRELEKKFSGKHVVFVAQRTIQPTTFNRGAAQKGGVRSRTRTLTHVQDAILDDIVYPTEIVGKRMIYKTDGTKQLKVFLNPKDVVTFETKLETFAEVYSSLTSKDVVFEFPIENL
jgi:small subunit ribosomal protein S7e